MLKSANESKKYPNKFFTAKGVMRNEFFDSVAKNLFVNSASNGRDVRLSDGLMKWVRNENGESLLLRALVNGNVGLIEYLVKNHVRAKEELRKILNQVIGEVAELSEKGDDVLIKNVEYLEDIRKIPSILEEHFELSKSLEKFIGEFNDFDDEWDKAIAVSYIAPHSFVKIDSSKIDRDFWDYAIDAGKSEFLFAVFANFSDRFFVEEGKRTPDVSEDYSYNERAEFSDFQGFLENYKFTTKKGFALLERILKVIDQKGLDKNKIVDSDLSSVFFYVKDLRVFNKLVEHGFDPKARNKRGHLPIKRFIHDYYHGDEDGKITLMLPIMFLYSEFSYKDIDDLCSRDDCSIANTSLKKFLISGESIRNKIKDANPNNKKLFDFIESCNESLPDDDGVAYGAALFLFFEDMSGERMLQHVDNLKLLHSVVYGDKIYKPISDYYISKGFLNLMVRVLYSNDLDLKLNDVEVGNLFKIVGEISKGMEILLERNPSCESHDTFCNNLQQFDFADKQNKKSIFNYIDLDGGRFSTSQNFEILKALSSCKVASVTQEDFDKCFRICFDYYKENVLDAPSEWGVNDNYERGSDALSVCAQMLRTKHNDHIVSLDKYFRESLSREGEAKWDFCINLSRKLADMVTTYSYLGEEYDYSLFREEDTDNKYGIAPVFFVVGKIRNWIKEGKFPDNRDDVAAAISNVSLCRNFVYYSLKCYDVEDFLSSQQRVTSHAFADRISSFDPSDRELFRGMPQDRIRDILLNRKIYNQLNDDFKFNCDELMENIVDLIVNSESSLGFVEYPRQGDDNYHYNRVMMDQLTRKLEKITPDDKNDIYKCFTDGDASVTMSVANTLIAKKVYPKDQKSYDKICNIMFRLHDRVSNDVANPSDSMFNMVSQEGVRKILQNINDNTDFKMNEEGLANVGVDTPRKRRRIDQAVPPSSAKGVDAGPAKSNTNAELNRN